MVSGRVLAAASSVVAVGLSVGVVQAADTAAGRKPTVAEVNGKIEFQGGPYAIDNFGGGAEWQGGASLSVPLIDVLGIQADVAISNTVDGNTLEGGMLHFFTRDPDAYLLGVTGGSFWANNANAQLIGPEVELYAEQFSLQAYAGLMHANIAGVGSDKLFAVGDVSYYATDDLMFKLGGKDVMDFKTAHLGLEYQISDSMPFSFTLDGRIGDDNYRAVDVGLKFYFGGPEKSLIRRHREDDPPNRILELFQSSGGAFVPPPPPPSYYYY